MAVVELVLGVDGSSKGTQRRSSTILISCVISGLPCAIQRGISREGEQWCKLLRLQ